MDYWRSSTIASNDWTDLTTVVSNSATRWNNLNDAVKISYTSVVSGSDIRVYANDYEEDYYGVLIPYYQNVFGDNTEDTGLDEEWTYAKIRLNIRTMKNDSFSVDNRTHTTIHEFGHALSLGHMNDVSNATVMKTGKLTYTKVGEVEVWHLDDRW